MPSNDYKALLVAGYTYIMVLIIKIHRIQLHNQTKERCSLIPSPTTTNIFTLAPTTVTTATTGPNSSQGQDIFNKIKYKKKYFFRRFPLSRPLAKTVGSTTRA